MSPFAPRRIAFRVEYDGTDFHGWQRQKDPGIRTVQARLAEAIAAFADGAATVDGASRTDAGVHARDQLAATTVRHPISPAGFVKAVNSRLGSDVAIRDAAEVAPDFAPRFANNGKTYIYRLYVGRHRRPLVDRFAWRIQWPLDREAMGAAAAHLVGTHDFTSFAARDGGHHQAVRTVVAITLGDEPRDLLTIEVRGTAFLKQMVRAMVGTLVEVGRGRRAPEDVAAIRLGRDRCLAGPTAPARGLTLEEVW